MSRAPVNPAVVAHAREIYSRALPNLLRTQSLDYEQLAERSIAAALAFENVRKVWESDA